MTHIIAFVLHALGINVWQRTGAGLGVQNLFRELFLVLWIVFGEIFLVFVFLALDEHFPEALGGNVVHALVCRGVAEDVGDCFAEFFHCDCEAVGFVGAFHVDEWVAGC